MMRQKKAAESSENTNLKCCVGHDFSESKIQVVFVMGSQPDLRRTESNHRSKNAHNVLTKPVSGPCEISILLLACCGGKLALRRL